MYLRPFISIFCARTWQFAVLQGKLMYSLFWGNTITQQGIQSQQICTSYTPLEIKLSTIYETTTCIF